MSDVEELSVVLPAGIATLLREAVETGEYVSASEAICEALQQWRERRDAAGLGAEANLGTDALRRLWDEGIASGRGRFTSIAQIKEEARHRFVGKPSA